MFNKLDQLLNGIPMYRVVLYGLVLLSCISILMGFVGILPYSGFAQLVNLGVILITCIGINELCSRVLRAPTNLESATITGLILFFLLWPIIQPVDVFFAILVSASSMAGKYILAIRKVHIFNPAAFGVFILGLLGNGNGIWWAGSLYLLPFVTCIGLCIVRKIRRAEMVLSFLVVSLLTLSIQALVNNQHIPQILALSIASGPLIFFATIMLTEPLTSPPRRRQQLLFGGLVGLMYGLNFQIGPLFSTPELALLIGNVVSFTISNKQRLILTLKEKNPLCVDIYDYVFIPSQPVSFIPGQYLEWLLPHERIDARGNRRYFTIASSPTEPYIHLGVKIPKDKKSSYKATLESMKEGDTLIASQLAGDFILPNDTTKKLVLIAGGIGITPFRSQIKYLVDRKEKRDIVLLYSASSSDGFVYKDLLDDAKSIGVRAVYSITKQHNVPPKWNGSVGYITKDMIKEVVPDYKERYYFISGPQSLVDSYKQILEELSISKRYITTDYFPGF